MASPLDGGSSRYDYLLPLITAELGDELWIALECAFITLARLSNEYARRA